MSEYELPDEFIIDDDGYYICPICKKDENLLTDRCANGGGETMPGWFVMCQECNVYRFEEYEPLLRPIPTLDKSDDDSL